MASCVFRGHLIPDAEPRNDVPSCSRHATKDFIPVQITRWVLGEGLSVDGIEELLDGVSLGRSPLLPFGASEMAQDPPGVNVKVPFAQEAGNTGKEMPQDQSVGSPADLYLIE